MPKKPEDPYRLVRETAGRYRSVDERFVVEQESPGAWYVADSLHTDDLGLPLLRGPFATLDAARQGAAGARDSKAPTSPKRTKPARKADGKADGKTEREAEAPKAPPPEPTSWLDALPPDEQRAARRLVGTIERAGVEGAEDLARRELESSAPVVALELLARALANRADDGRLTPEDAVDVLLREGFDKDRGRPARGWRLVELDERGRPTGRTIERR
jgi:hypothetical protein